MALVFDKIMPKVSIIIPVYNVEKYIARAIESLIRQTLYDIEIVVVNDGSKDNSQKIIKSFNDSRIHLYNQENKGSAHARNIGISNAHGEYIMFLDADDYYDNDCVEKAYNRIKLENTDICIYGSRHIDQDGKLVKRVVPTRTKTITLEDNKDFLLEIENCPWDKIYKTSIIKESNITYPEGLYYEDLAFTFNILANIKSISFINDELLTYNVGREGSATDEISERIFDIYKIVDLIIDIYSDNNMYDTYYEEIKAISTINIIDKLKQVIRANNKDIREKYLNSCYDFIEDRFNNFKSKYNLSKHPRDFIYFNKKLLNIYMLVKGVN